MVVLSGPWLVGLDFRFERVVYEREEPQVIAERVVARDRGEHRGDVRADTSFRVAEARRTPVEPGLQPGVGEQLSLEFRFGGDRLVHVDSTGVGSHSRGPELPHRVRHNGSLAVAVASSRVT